LSNSPQKILCCHLLLNVLATIMPDRKTHEFLTRALTGKDYSWVHDVLDVAVKELGPHHRRYTHNQETVAMIFLQSGGDLGALIAAEAHIMADVEVSRAQRILNHALGLDKLNNFRRKR
jgi:hypothetical protein